MVTEEEANLAREKHSSSLVRRGAHAIAIEEINKGGKKTFVVKVFVVNSRKKMPSILKIMSGKKIVKVPVIVKVEEKFLAE